MTKSGITHFTLMLLIVGLTALISFSQQGPTNRALWCKAVAFVAMPPRN